MQHEATALALGGGGLFLRINAAVRPGDVLSLRFRPARHLSMIEATARVCYQLADQRAGVEFTEISAAHREQILRLILHRVGDQRRYPRRPLATQVEHAGGAFIGFSKDISAAGMFIETQESLPEETQLELRFHLEEGDCICRASAQVRYEVSKMGIGVEFTEILPEDRKRIEAYVSATGMA
jgi:c-di-GMP-binding flagellar brake protein YcgR